MNTKTREYWCITFYPDITGTLTLYVYGKDTIRGKKVKAKKMD